MIENKIEDWLLRYASLFEQRNLDELVNCYTVPSTMSTPEKVVIMQTEDDVKNQMSDILLLIEQSQLQHARVLDLRVYPLDSTLAIANCRWQMEDLQGEVFAEFNTVYQLVYSKNEFRILNVTSYYQD